MRIALLIVGLGLAADAAAQERAVASRGQDADVSFSDGRPRFRIGDLRLDLRGRVQADHKPHDMRDTDREMTRYRVGVDGRVGRFGFEVDFAPFGDQPLRDAAGIYRFDESLQVRGGQFKVPFGREATTSAANLAFVERSQGSKLLAPGRDRGVAVRGRVFEVMSYEAGVFQRDGRDGRLIDGDETLGERAVASRVTVEPFAHRRSRLSGLTTGVAFMRSSQPEGLSQLDMQSALDGRSLWPALWASGPRQRFGLDVRWEPGPVGVWAEYLEVRDERRGQGVAGEDLPPLVARAWYVAASWLVTGEPSRREVRPRAPILQGGAGAIELAVRHERFVIGDRGSPVLGAANPRAADVPGSAQHITTAGVNWYANRWLKVQANLVQERFDGAALLRRSSPSRWAQVLRAQFSM